ncbi:hypothetical protein PybrP1_006485 [[Pythium] brassicae (nom. inval.)]|nr:hypothetical protein PybrP1_006485 [[Pythium] brassicae (nom. inval.)]
MAQAVLPVHEGATQAAAATFYRVLERTLQRKFKLQTTGQPPVPPGPPPVLGLADEQDIRDWIVGMQRNRTLVGRLHVILKPKEVYAIKSGRTRSVDTNGRGWYYGFTKRFSEVVVHKAQIFKRVREGITHDSACYCLAAVRATIEHGIGADRCINVDETAFAKT